MYTCRIQHIQHKHTTQHAITENNRNGHTEIPGTTSIMLQSYMYTKYATYIAWKCNTTVKQTNTSHNLDLNTWVFPPRLADHLSPRTAVPSMPQEGATRYTITYIIRTFLHVEARTRTVYQHGRLLHRHPARTCRRWVRAPFYKNKIRTLLRYAPYDVYLISR